MLVENEGDRGHTCIAGNNLLLMCTTAITSLHLNHVSGEYCYVCHDLDPLLLFFSRLLTVIIFRAWEGLVVLIIRDSLHTTKDDNRILCFLPPVYSNTNILAWHLGKDGRTLVCVFY